MITCHTRNHKVEECLFRFKLGLTTSAISFFPDDFCSGRLDSRHGAGDGGHEAEAEAHPEEIPDADRQNVPDPRRRPESKVVGPEPGQNRSVQWKKSLKLVLQKRNAKVIL